MNSLILALRAIGTNLAMRLFVPVVVVLGVILGLLVAGNALLTTYSGWWWLLFIPLVILCSIAAAVTAVIWMLIRYVRPSQTKAQKQAVSRFVDKMQGVTEVASTPKSIILFRVVRSIAAPNKDRYLAHLVENKELVKDFRNVQHTFDDIIVIE